MNLTDVSMSLNVFGYGDASLQGGDLMHDIATATAYPTGGTGAPITGRQSADVAIEPNQTQLGVFKAFGTLKSGPGGDDAAEPDRQRPDGGGAPRRRGDDGPAAGSGCSWANPLPRPPTSAVTKGPWRLRHGRSAGTLQDIPNFSNTVSELIRITLPAVGVHGRLLHDHRRQRT